MLEGVFLPIITPFHNGDIDEISLRKIIDHYIDKKIAGIVPLGTTGESPTVNDHEYERIIAITVEQTHGRVPIYAGAGGNDTAKVINLVSRLEKHRIDGILSVGPYFNRPDQRGIYEHFKALSESTSLGIIIYNIPYRTGRNIENDTIRRLAEMKNIIGLKDSCGDIKQSAELLLDPPQNFSILTGEDIQYFSILALGGRGGILAAAHLQTENFVKMHELIRNNDHHGALDLWKSLTAIVSSLFMEPNPAPVKYCLFRQGLIRSSETRLPIVGITEKLKTILDGML